MYMDNHTEPSGTAGGNRAGSIITAAAEATTPSDPAFPAEVPQPHASETAER